MAITLETLLLEFQGDFSKLDAAMDSAVNRAKQKMSGLEKQVIKPKVDLDPLHDLNKLLDVKQKHLKETVDFFKNNPIKVSYEDDEPPTRARKTTRVKVEADDAGVNKVGKTIEKVLYKAIMGGFSLAMSPLKGIMGGIFQQIGMSIARDFSKGLAQSLAQNLQSNLNVNLQDLGKQVGDHIARTIFNNYKAPTPPQATQASGRVINALPQGQTIPPNVREAVEANLNRTLNNYAQEHASTTAVLAGYKTAIQRSTLIQKQSAESVEKTTLIQKGVLEPHQRQLPAGSPPLPHLLNPQKTGETVTVDALFTTSKKTLAAELNNQVTEAKRGTEVAKQTTESTKKYKETVDKATQAKQSVAKAVTESPKVAPRRELEAMRPQPNASELQKGLEFYNKSGRVLNKTNGELGELQKLVNKGDKSQLSNAELDRASHLFKKLRGLSLSIVHSYDSLRLGLQDLVKVDPSQAPTIKNEVMKLGKTHAKAMQSLNYFSGVTEQSPSKGKAQIANRLKSEINMASTGEEITNGLKIGASPAKFGKIGTDGASVFDAAFRRRLGIFSPSRVFKQHGSDVFEGFNIGANPSKFANLGKFNANAFNEGFKSTIDLKNLGKNPKVVEYEKQFGRRQSLDDLKNFNLQDARNLDDGFGFKLFPRKKIVQKVDRYEDVRDDFRKSRKAPELTMEEKLSDMQLKFRKPLATHKTIPPKDPNATDINFLRSILGIDRGIDFASIGNGLKSLDLGSKLASIKSGLKGFVESFGNSVKSAFSGNNLGERLALAIGNLRASVGQFAHNMKRNAQEFFNLGTGNNRALALRERGTLAPIDTNRALANIEAANKALVKVVSGTQLAVAISSLGDNTGKFIQSIAVGGKLQVIGNGLKGALVSLSDSVSKESKEINLGERLQMGIGNLRASMGQFLHNLKRSTQEFFNIDGLKSNLGSIFSSIKSSVKNYASKVASMFKGATSDNSIKALAVREEGALTNQFNAITRPLSNFVARLSNITDNKKRINGDANNVPLIGSGANNRERSLAVIDNNNNALAKIESATNALAKVTSDTKALAKITGNNPRGILPNNTERRLAVLEANRKVSKPSDLLSDARPADYMAGMANIKSFTSEHINQLKGQQEAYAANAKAAREQRAATQAVTDEILKQAKMSKESIFARAAVRQANRFDQNGNLTAEALESYAQVFRRKLRQKLGNMTGETRVSENNARLNDVTSMGFSAAMMMNPKVGLGLAIAPFIAGLTPVIVPLLGVANMFKGIVPMITKGIMEVDSVLGKFESIGNLVAGDKDEDRTKNEYNDIRALSNEYKLGIAGVMTGYSDIRSATSRTRLEGSQTEKLYTGILAMSRVSRMSQDETAGVLKAFTQMAAKGVVQMEELRGQLGDRFPPALQDFSKALGISSAELVALSRAGRLNVNDVFPKLAEYLNKRYGEEAKTSMIGLSAQMNVLGNSFFNLKAVMRDSLGGTFGSVAGIFAKLTDLFAGNFETIKLLTISGTIGIAAVMGVGLQSILATPKIAAMMGTFQATFMTAWGGMARSLTPFVIASLIDVFDKIIGTENTVIDNISGSIRKLAEGVVFGVLRDFTPGVLQNNVKVREYKPGDGIRKELGFLERFRIPSGLVELPILMMTLQQTVLLIGKFSNPIMTSFAGSLATVGKNMKAVFATKQGWQGMHSALMPLTAGIKSLAMSLASYGAQAVLVFAMMALARSKFVSDTFVEMAKLQKSLGSTLTSLNTTIESGKDTTTKKGITPGMNEKGVQSMGLEINPARVMGFSKNSYKSDDSRNAINANVEALREKLAKEGEMAGSVYGKGFFAEFRKRMDEDTVAAYDKKVGKSQKNFADTPDSLKKAIGLDAGDRATTAQKDINDIYKSAANQLTTVKDFLKNNGLEQGKETLLNSDIYGKALEDVKAFDKELMQIQSEKLNYVVNNPTISLDDVQLAKFTARTEDLLKKRAGVIGDLQDIATGIDSSADNIQKQIDTINNDATLTPEVKRILLEPLKDSETLIKRVKDYFKEIGLSKVLEPATDKWTKISTEIAKTASALEKAKIDIKLNSTNSLSSVYEKGLGIDNVALADAEKYNAIDSYVQQQGALTTALAAKEQQLNELLSIPLVESDDTKRKEIETLRKDVIAGKQELADNRLALAKARREMAMIQETRRLNKVFSGGQGIVDNIANSTANSVFTNSTRALQQKLALDMNDVTSGIFDASNRLKEASMNLSGNAQQLAASTKFLGANVSDAAKAWATEKLGFKGSFDDLLKGITAKDASRLSTFNSEESSATPERTQLVRELQEIATLNESSKQLTTASLQSKLDIKSSLKNAQKTYTSFIDGITDEVSNAKRAIEDLKLGQLFNQFTATLNKGLKAGSESIFRTFTTAIGTGIGGLQGVLSQLGNISKTKEDIEKRLKEVKQSSDDASIDTSVLDKSVFDGLAKSINTSEFKELNDVLAQNQSLAAQQAVKLKELKDVRVSELEVLKAGVDLEFSNWLTGFNHDLASAMNGVNDIATDASKNMESFTLRLSDLRGQFITLLSPLEAAIKAVKDAYKGLSTELDDFEMSIKKSLGIDADKVITEENAGNLVSESVNVGTIMQDLKKFNNLPSGMQGSIDALLTQYNAGLITAKDGLTAILKLIPASRNTITKEQQQAIDAEKARVKRERKIESRNYKFNYMEDLVNSEDDTFKTDIDKDNDKLDVDKLKLKQAYLGTVDEINEKERKREISGKEADTRRIEAQNLYNQKLDVAIKKVSLMNKIGGKVFEGLQTGLADSFMKFGEALAGGGDREAAIQEARLEHAEKVAELADEYADRPDLFRQMKDNLDVLNESKLDGIKSEFNALNAFVDTLKSAVSGLIKEIGTLMAKQAAAKIVGGIFGGFNFSQGTENFSSGVGNFSAGVENMNGGSYLASGSANNNASVDTLGYSMRMAMIREGSNAVPAVLHRGEAVLSARTKDAQLYRALKRNGTWDSLKSNSANMPTNFSQGTMEFSGKSSSALIGSRVNNVSTNIIINTPDYKGFNRSQSQVRAAQASRDEYAKRRFQ